MIHFECTSCHRSLTAPEDARGQVFHCPLCDGPIAVPDAPCLQPAQEITLDEVLPPRSEGEGSADHEGSATIDEADPPEAGKSAKRASSVFDTRLSTHLIRAGLGLAACSALFLALGALGLPAMERLTHRGWTPYAAGFLTLTSLSILRDKAGSLKKRRRLFEATFLPRHQLGSEGDVVSAIRAIEATSKDLDDNLVGPRLRRALNHFRVTGKVKEVNDILREESEADFAWLDSSYAPVRVFVGTIPLLGFIGTVMGVGNAVGGFGSFLAVAHDVNLIRDALGGVTSGLGTAFDTTLVALLLSVIVMLVMSTVEKAEKDQLQKLETLCRDELLACLPPAPAAGDRVTAAALQDAIRQIVPGIDAWRREAERLASQLSAGLAEQWQALSRDWIAGLRSLEENLSSHYANIDEERAAVREAARELLDRAREHFEQQQDNLKGVIDAERNLVSDALSVQRQLVEKYNGNLERTAATVTQLVELQRELEQGLLDASGSDGIGPVLRDVRTALQALGPALHRITDKPLDVEVRFLAGMFPTNGASDATPRA